MRSASKLAATAWRWSRGWSRIFHREDPTRLVTVGCDRIAANLTGREVGTPPEFLEVLDVVGYNYLDRWRERAEKYYSVDRHAFPQRRIIGTENASMGGVRGDYSELFPAAPGAVPRRRGTIGGPMSSSCGSSEDLRLRVRRPHVDGYRLSWASPRGPRRARPSGVMDTCGFEKDGYYFYQSQWTDKPMIHLFPHWNWKGKEGEVIPVLCYTNCDTVELFVNGKSLGVQGYWFPRVGYWRSSTGRGARPRAPRRICT